VGGSPSAMLRINSRDGENLTKGAVPVPDRLT
jgi:hypothetical protein